MSLGIMQPYFFPYTGYFALIYKTDQWVVFDSSQYTPKSWINRNRILSPAKEWEYINVPLSNSSQSVRISEVKIKDVEATKLNILGKLNHFRKKAPYVDEVINIVNSTFDSLNSESLTQLNILGLKNVCEYLGIEFKFILSSSLDINMRNIIHPGSWALEICVLMDAMEYVNPIGGKHLFKIDEFKDKNIKLSFLELVPLVYQPGRFKYVENLSILDVLMWNSVSEVISHLNSAKVESAY
jgi:hypothetical protein